jgi:hypothetical protein
MIFKSRSVKQTGPQAADVAGDLRLHGVTKPLILQVKLLTPVNQGKVMGPIALDRDYSSYQAMRLCADVQPSAEAVSPELAKESRWK